MSRTYIGSRISHYYLLAVAIIVLDQVTKYWVQGSFFEGQRLQLLPFFDFTLVYNKGAAFSFLANESGWQRWFFAAIAIGVSIALTIWLMTLKSTEKWIAAALVLIIGGALGNLYDRMVFGHVIDFIHVHWGENYFPAFNIADSAITMGAIMLIIDSLFLSSENTEK